MYLQSAEIQNFHGIRNLVIDFEKDTTVLIGENAWGKSSLLCALSTILGQGSDSLCSFTKDDLYIPIKLSGEDEGESESQGDTDIVDTEAQDINQELEANDSALKSDNLKEDHVSSVKDKAKETSPKLAIPYAHDEGACREYLHCNGLDDIDPIKIINTPTYQRRYYSVINHNGTGRTLHIVDFPCEQHRPLTDRWGKPSKNSAKNKHFNCHTTKRRKSKQQPRHISNALTDFIADFNKTHYDPNLSYSLTRSNLSKTPVKKSVLDALSKGLEDEARYEQEQPLFYRPTSQERVALMQNTLESQNELNVEGRTSAQEDLKFFSSDIYKDVAEAIVIDLIFCEGNYG